MEQSLTQNVETLFTNLEDFTQNEGVIGKPVTYGDKTFIPIVSVTLGYGSGNSAAKSQTGSTAGTTGTGMGTGAGAGNMAGGALGLGAKLSAEAVILIDKDNVSMLQINATNASQIIDKIPQIISGMGQNKQGQGQQQNQAQGQQGQQQ